MEAVIRPVIVYFFLLIIFSLAGKRAVAEMDTFDMITMLIISEATQNVLLGDNSSLTHAFLVIVTLMSCTVIMAWVKARFPVVEKFLQGGPLVIIENGRMLRSRMKRAYVDEQDILSSARLQGIENLSRIKFAILESSGKISIIPYEK